MMKPPRSIQIIECVLLVSLLVGLAVHQSEALLQKKSKCPPSRDLEMDICASKMGFLGDHSFRLPKNITAMEGFCKDLKNSLSCIQSYSRDCMQGFTKQILNSLLKRGKQQYNFICQNEQSKRELMTRLECLGDEKIEHLHRCMDASTARFEFIRANVRPEFRLPSLCCSYQIFNRDIDSTLDQVCGPRAASQAAGSETGVHAFIHKVVSGTTGEFFQLICDNHRTMAECQASDKTKEVLKRLELVTRNAKQGKTKPKSKSLIPPLLDILDSSDPV